MLIYDISGIIGDCMVIGAYFLLQNGRLAANSYPYLLINIVASVAILFSLLSQWSITLFFIQTSWLAISLYGLLRARSQQVSA